MRRKFRQLIACVLTVMLVISCFTAVAASPLTLPDLISDNMLIQRDMPIRLWGFGGISGDTLTARIEDQKGVAVSEGTTTIGDDGFNIELPALEAGGPYTIRFLNDKGDKLKSVYNVLIGDLWFQGGQSNMQLTVGSIDKSIEERVTPNPKDDTIRLFYNGNHFYADEPATDLEGKWIIADKDLRDYSAIGYGALETIHNEIGVPVGGICSPYGGSVISEHIAPDGNIYKSKIAPATQFNIKGIMWYQGETDRNRGIEVIENNYNSLISSLRQAWNNENLPFIMVQLHPSPMKGLVYGSTTEYEIKDFSDARVAIGNVYAGNDNVGMAVAYDLSTTKYRADGEDPSHPWIKAPLAKRMGNVALSMVYGKEIDANSPLYISKSVNGNELTLKFKDTYDGLKTTDGSEPKGFMIAGEDGVYYEAKAVLSGDKVTLTSDKVANPVNASYGLEKHYWPYPGGPKDQESIDAVPDLCVLDINVVNSSNLPVAAFDTATSIGKSESTEAPAEQEQTPSAPVKVEEIENSGDKTVLYVAKDGSDSNNGSIDKPFASLEKARDTIRALKKEGKLGEGGAVVYIRGGEYLRQSAFALTSEDSGTENAPIIYRNYPEEEVKFTGGVNIASDKFKKVTDQTLLERIVDKKAREKIVEVDMFALGYKSLPEQTLPGKYSYTAQMQQIHGLTAPEAVASELIVDGASMVLARYPNEGYMYIETVIEPGVTPRNWHDDRKGTPEYVAPEDRKNTPFTVTVADDRLANWTNAKDALISGCFYYSWADQTVPVAEVNPTKRSITSKYPSEYSVLQGQYFYIYNLIEEIDIPGEYFIDREAGKLYLYPPTGGIGNVIFTSLDEYMFLLEGAEYITIKGIDMSYMRNGAVKMTDAVGCSVVACDVNHTGNMAIYVEGSKNKVYDCHIYDVNKGIQVIGGDAETLTHAMNVVENNHIERADRISKTYSPGITFSGVGNYILHNKLNDADHLVMNLYGQEHTIAYNEIYDACKHTDDMGAIYTGRNLIDRGNKILYNYIHDIGGSDLGANGVHGIFLDDWWSAALMRGNVFENITGGGVMFAGSHNELINNIFINCGKTAGILTRSYNYGNTDSEYTFRNTIENAPYIYSDLWLERYPSIANVISEDNKLDMNNYIVVKNNVLYNTPDFKIADQMLPTMTNEGNMSFTSDPGFYDLENRNYLLKPDSEVYEKNPEFQPILFTRMGNYSDRALDRVKNASVFCAESPYMMKNGDIIKEKKNAATVINGKIYVPVRTGVDAVGGEIGYNEETAEVSISTAEKAVSFISGNVQSVNINGVETTLINPIVHKSDTNYISVEDLASLFGMSLTQKGNTAVISDIENLFTETVDDGLLRYIEEQLTVY